MNKNQIHGLIREAVYAVALLLASFNVLKDSQLDVVVPLFVALGLLIWGVVGKNETKEVIFSLARKAAQAVSPVLVSFGLVQADQGAAISGVVLILIGFWSVASNRGGN